MSSETTDIEARSASTGSPGLDEMLNGGFPVRRVTAILGGPGAGKTVLSIQTVAAAVDNGTSAVVVAFEQTSERLRDDVGHFSWGAALTSDRVEFIDAIFPPYAMVTGDFDLEGLLAVLDEAVTRIDARLIVLDGVDALLSMLANEEDERRELSRLGSWLRDNEITAIITAKSTDAWPRGQVRTSLIDYQADCVVKLLTTRSGAGSSRSVLVSKLRGSAHDGNIVPMLIGSEGIQAMPFRASVGRPAPRTSVRISSGVAELDDMLDGGYYIGSSTLISGPPGAAKTTLAAAFAQVASETQPTLLVSYDETREELLFHMASVGYELASRVGDSLHILSFARGIDTPEEQVAAILRHVDEHGITAVVVDPISAMEATDHPHSDLASAHLFRELDRRSVTVVCTSLLTDGSVAEESSRSKLSTIVDTWIHVTYVAHGGERNRALTIIKSRGTSTSNQVRELIITDRGAHLQPVYAADGEVLVGSARAQREAADRRAMQAAEELFEHEEAERAAELFALELEAKQLQARIVAKTRARETARRNQTDAVARADQDRDARRDLRARSHSTGV